MLVRSKGRHDEHWPRPELHENDVSCRRQWNRQNLRQMSENGGDLHSSKDNRPVPICSQSQKHQRDRKQEVNEREPGGQLRDRYGTKGDGY
jgi:hypothetical protein